MNYELCHAALMGDFGISPCKVFISLRYHNSEFKIQN